MSRSSIVLWGFLAWLDGAMREERKKGRLEIEQRHVLREIQGIEKTREEKGDKMGRGGARNDRPARAVVQSGTKYKKERLGRVRGLLWRSGVKGRERIRRTRPRNGAVEKREGYGKGRRERFERRVSPSARCFVREGGREGGRDEGVGARRGDKNSPNPSLITMPAKSEILTAVAPRRATSR